jgi:hypothetical protein
VTDTCPTCDQSLPEEVTWRYVRQTDDGRWEASVQLGRFVGWALRKTEEEARQKALARLYYAKDYL